VDPERRDACRLDLRRFCDTYHPATFCLPWSADHLRVLAKAQAAVLLGAQLAVAMPRASGKTSIVIAAVEWALLFGHRRFVVVVGSSETAAVELLKLVKADLETPGTLISEDFPAVTAPIEALERIANRCAGQTLDGVPTAITWTDRELVLPTVPDSPASGSILRVAGITGRLRGMVARLPDGSTARPDVVLIDDPQTDDSARSLTQCAARERILAGAVLGLAGPGKRIAALAAVTVIRPGDVADNLVDRTHHPAWNGERTKLVYEFPTDTKLWEQYAELRGESLRTHGDIRDATAFYAANREAMDKGAVVAWPERRHADELSALQHAMNLRLADEGAFQAEYQNEPIALGSGQDDDVGILGADEIARRLNGCQQRVVPIGATRVTAAVDVQQGLLYWLVAAWGDDFTGWVIDYGTFPEQDRERFTYAEAQSTLQRFTPGAGVEGQLQAGLQALTTKLCTTEWGREDGAPMRLERCLIDANWSTSTDIVYALCRRSAHAVQLAPSHGAHFGLAARPIHETPKKPGDRVGYGWRMPGDAPAKLVRFDAGRWKTFVHSRFATEPGDAGALTLFGKQPARHRMLAEHLTSETRERLRGASRVVDVWTLTKHRDNHLLDCLVGAAVAASIGGAALPGMDAARQPRPRKVVKFSEMQGRRRA